MEMCVLSVEGPAYVDKSNWSTHKILCAGHRAVVDEYWRRVKDDFDSNDIVILTVFADATSVVSVERLPTG